ncbi:MAG: hypothetical protein IKF79_08125, partial [Methanosphaera sp.]|nr:hypothetical protein [Methanosphaera sp.]
MKGKSIILLLVTLLILMVGAVNAADINNDGINVDISDSISTDAPIVNEVAVQEKQSVSIEDTNTVEKINKKQESDTNLIKNMNNLKKDTTVSSWEDLESEINSATQNTTITLNRGTYTVTGRIDFNKPITITIDGNGQTIDGNQKQVFNITSSSSVIFKNITIKNAENTGGNGGAIYNSGNLTIINSTLKNNTATGQQYGRGGAIYNNGGTLTITDSNLNNNTATGQYGDGLGGAIYNYYRGNLTITGSNFTQNTATGQGQYGWGLGGAIYNKEGGTLNITGSNLNNNTATGQDGNGYGGAINNDGTLNITGSNLNNNTATGQNGNGYGGAIYNIASILIITDSNLYNNTATGGGGGAIYNRDSDAFIEYNYFIANIAQMTGNAIINDGTALIDDNEGDTTTPYHGTIYTDSDKTVIIEHNKFHEKVDTNIIISVNNTKPVVNDKININFILKDLFGLRLSNEQLNITINEDKQNMMTNEEGELSIEYIANHVGTDTITVTYEGNSQYNQSTNLTTVIIYQETILTIKNTPNAMVNKTVTIYGQLLDNTRKLLANQEIIIDLGDESIATTTDEYGNYQVNITPKNNNTI